MPAYELSPQLQESYRKICEKGIGWNIAYAKGTMKVNDKGKLELAQPKAIRLYNDIMSEYIQHITCEGGKRGGKDVYALYSWANYLMICPDKLHLATGQTAKHALATIYEADGFGLKYLLPHSILYTIDNGKVLQFMDFYGVVKNVMFYGGGEKNDSEKFRGISFGSHYANEAINQAYESINEGRSRTIASKMRKIIHTQNPEAGTFEYYEKYEKPLIASDEEAIKIESKKKSYEREMQLCQVKIAKAKIKEKERILNVYLNTLELRSEQQLRENIDAYQKYVQSIRSAYRKIDKQFEPSIRPDYINFVHYYDNPNGIKNGLNFRYHHFTFHDNLSMTDLDREKVADAYDKSGVVYRREILGIRASSDYAIWDTLTTKNIMHGEIPEIYAGDRWLSVDYGMKNAFVVSDWEVLSDFTCKCYEEYRFDGNKMSNSKEIYVPPTNSFYANKIKEMIEKRNDKQYVAVIVDPSATGLMNELAIMGISFVKAKNDVGLKHKVDTASNKKIDKSLRGIWLVRDGFKKLKVFIHENCKEGINECVGYSFDAKKLQVGIEEVVKVNDHFCDCVRYLVNTVVRKEKHWNNE